MPPAPLFSPKACAAELDRALEQYAAFHQAHWPWFEREGSLPRSAQGNSVWRVPAHDWTSGFPAGSMWLLYEHSGQPRERAQAERWTRALFEQRLNRETHDVGFMINNSFGQGYRLTHDRALAEVVVEAARSLSSRFNTKVGALRSWSFGDWAFPVIIDNMMNLELLCHASALANDRAFVEIAETHALTTLRDHFRKDASSYHLVDYHPSSGNVLCKQTRQGVHDESAWARGQAWGLYGFSMMYENTGDDRFLGQACKIADYFTQHPGLPDDKVPYFDFAVNDRADLPKHRDASAAAIAAAALLQLSAFPSCPDPMRYRDFAWAALASLASSNYRAASGSVAHFLIEHSVGSYPEGHEVDAAINYADYYYIEALLRGARLAGA